MVTRHRRWGTLGNPRSAVCAVVFPQSLVTPVHYGSCSSLSVHDTGVEKNTQAVAPCESTVPEPGFCSRQLLGYP
ncbi:Uncharacterised protein [Serratia fonticola]|nr:Uncharacterised protein [Serratia fonticola]CAI1731968.1 Uncharacterised protein [Serratia fonticola]CAI1995420.1 Uncharacterised protein [Serratia fonticola]CAI2002778.1 Uncharacterised protein [Serratia fonticola]